MKSTTASGKESSNETCATIQVCGHELPAAIHFFDAEECVKCFVGTAQKKVAFALTFPRRATGSGASPARRCTPKRKRQWNANGVEKRHWRPIPRDRQRTAYRGINYGEGASHFGGRVRVRAPTQHGKNPPVWSPHSNTRTGGRLAAATTMCAVAAPWEQQREALPPLVWRPTRRELLPQRRALDCKPWVRRRRQRRRRQRPLAESSRRHRLRDPIPYDQSD
jgi:hypothetical protein